MTYEYLCTACSHVWEAEQSISEAPLTACPRCEKQTAKRQVSGGAGFILKGGGWYSDLYASAPKKSADATTDASSSGEAKKTADTTKKTEPASSDAGTSKKETGTSSGGSDGGSKGSSGSGSKGGTDSSAA